MNYCFDLGNTSLPPLQIAFGEGESSCVGSDEGEICLAVSGGKPPYSFLWENGATSLCANGLSANQCYSVTVIDDCGEEVVDCFNIPVYQLPTIDLIEINNTCGEASTGSAEIVHSGGRGPFSFDWAGVNVNTTTSQDFLNNLGVGEYSVTITDLCGNSDQSTFVIGSNPTPATLEILDFTITHICEDDGAIDITVNYPGIVSFEWSNGAITEDIEGLSGGQYFVTVSNGAGCEVIEKFTVNSSHFFPSSEVNHSCETGGSIDLNFSGTFSPFTYQWENEMEGSFLDGLVPGTYVVTITNFYWMFYS